MSKSTPISQLPSSDNGSMQGDVIEDDATVQEVLSQISQSAGSDMQQQQPLMQQFHPPPPTPTSMSSSSPSQLQQQQQQQQFQQHQQQYMVQQLSQAQQLPGTAQQLMMNTSPQQQPAAQPFYFQMPPYQPSQVAADALPPQGVAMHEESSISNEIRLILLVVIVSIVIQIIPIDILINRINILGKIPYSPVFVKAFIAGALFFAIRKYIS